MKPPRWVLPVLLFLVATIPHLGGLRNGFVYDDRGLIVESRSVTQFDLRGIWGGPYWPDLPEAGLYRPIVSTTYAANWALTPNRPAPFIATNILLHAATTLLAFWLLLKLFPGRRSLAAAAAGIFAVHPIHVEAVVGIVGRAEILAALFTIAAYGLWLDAEKGNSPLRRILPAPLWLLGLLSKESAIALPVILIAQRLGLAGASATGKRLRVTDISWAIALGIGILLRVAAIGPPRSPDATFVDNPLARLDLLWRALGAGGVLADQIPQFLALVPFSCDYSFAAVDPGAPLYAWGGLALLIAAAGAGLALTRGKGTPEGWGILFFLVCWGITSNIVMPIGTARADRLQYLPLLGIAVLASAGCSRIRLGNARDRWFAALACIVIAWCGVVSVRRVADWHDDIRLWRSAVRVEPASLKARTNLGMLLLQAQTPGAARETLSLLEPVVGLDTTYGPLLHTEGKARMFLGENARARELLEEAIRFGADSANVMIELGNIALATQDGERALECFNSVKRMGRELRHAEIGRASAFSIMGRYDESASTWRTLVDQLPDSVPIRIAYAWNLTAARRPGDAAGVLRAGVERRRDPRLWNALSRTALGVEGAQAEALTAALRAVRGDPSQESLTTLARAQIAAGRTADALLTRARITDPDSLGAIDRVLRRAR